jgi:hypothetical protein
MRNQRLGYAEALVFNAGRASGHRLAFSGPQSDRGLELSYS